MHVYVYYKILLCLKENEMIPFKFRKQLMKNFGDRQLKRYEQDGKSRCYRLPSERNSENYIRDKISMS